MSDELIGAELGGRYRVEQKVGDAMLGRVYSARSVEDGRLYHVKVPYANVAGNPEKSERFRRELEAMARIENPHTLRVIDTGIHDSVAFLVLEYLAATPLSDVLERGPLKPARVAGIVAQIATACEAAHAAGIVHRNLSPQTILLLDNARDRDFVKVTDFGLSRIVDADADEAGGVLTQAGTRIGNVSYMAPEYIEQDEVLPAGDMYALGALTFHLLSGKPPYVGKAADVLTRHVTDDPPRLSTLVPGLPGWCDSLVAQLMQKDPTRRPSPRKVVAALEQELGSLKAPKLLGIDEDGKVLRKSRAPLWIAIAGMGVAAMGATVAGLAVAGAVALWLLTRVEELVPESGDLTPRAGATLDPSPSAPTPPPTTPRPETPRGKSKQAPAAPGTPAPGAPADPPPPDPAPAARAVLRVTADQRALVHLDDVPVGYTPLDVPLSPGHHVVAATLPSKAGSRQQREIDAVEGTPVSIEFDF